MTDFKEEQINEIEALESIYPDELEVIETEPYHVFRVKISSQDTEEEDDIASCVIQFTYTQNYPEEAPLFEFDELENIDDAQLNEITDFVNQQIEENLGMVVVFTIVSALQEKLNDLVDDTINTRREEAERKEQEREEAEMKRFEGTKVTIETFLAWKTKFDAEMAELKRQKSQQIQGPKGQTGKEMFYSDQSMIDSDVKFLESEEDSVEVDESLFQDMDDLDIDEDDMLEEVGD